MFELSAYLDFLYGEEPIYVYQKYNNQNNVGIYSSAERLINAKHRGDVYTNLHPLDASLAKTNRVTPFNRGFKETDIVCQRFICIDIDPTRAAKINATDTEKAAALGILEQAVDYIQAKGFPYITKDSGNGYHMLVRALDLTKEKHKAILAELKLRFDTPAASIDISCFNNSRVHRLPGTRTHKLASDDRPQRTAQILDIVPRDSIPSCDILLTLPILSSVSPALVTSVVIEDKPTRQRRAVTHAKNIQTVILAMQEWIDINKFPVHRHDTVDDSGGYKWILSECPWDAAHTDNSAYILVLSTGAVSAGCMHTGCQGHKDNNPDAWTDLNSQVSQKYSLRQYKLANSELAQPERSINLTDLGNAKLFAKLYGDKVRYATDVGMWYVFNGKAWRPDKTNIVHNLASTIPSVLRAEAKRDKDNVDDQLLKHAYRSESMRSLNAIIAVAKGLDSISIESETFDSHYDKLNVNNGTVDLRTGLLYPHEAEQYHSKLVPFDYTTGETPIFDSFFEGLTDDIDAREYILSVLGYSLTGHHSEQALYFLFGIGRNGKTTLLELIAHILGDYAQGLDVAVLFSKDQHPTGMTDMQGMRFVYVDDPSRNRELDVGLIKRVTGANTIRAHKMHKDYYSFKLTHKIWIAANYKPLIREQDDGIWERMKLIKCTHQYFEGKGRDTALPDKLRTEASGILHTLVQYAVKYFAEGIVTPNTIKSEVQQYKSEMDILANFMLETIIIDTNAHIGAKDFYEQYLLWCLNNHEKPLSSRMFTVLLTERRFKQYIPHDANGKSFRAWQGIRLLSYQEQLVNTNLVQLLHQR